MKQIFKKKKFTVEVVHFKEGNGHFEIKEEDKLVARESWVTDPTYYQINIIPTMLGEVKTSLGNLKF